MGKFKTICAKLVFYRLKYVKFALPFSGAITIVSAVVGVVLSEYLRPYYGFIIPCVGMLQFAILIVLYVHSLETWQKELPEYHIKEAWDMWPELNKKEPELADMMDRIACVAERDMNTEKLTAWMKEVDVLSSFKSELAGLHERKKQVSKELQELQNEWKTFPSKEQVFQKKIYEAKMKLLDEKEFLS